MGRIFNIQRYSVNDGPGIRTTIFLKGCPLACKWCHNPESQSKNIQILINDELCKLCGFCVQECEKGCLSIIDGRIKVDDSNCDICKKCTYVCGNDAINIVGKDILEEELIKEILKDQDFYEESKGGVTFSGGEPLYQKDFLRNVLCECCKKGIHTAVDTSGYAKTEDLIGIADYTDLFLYDIKHMNDSEHVKYTGVSNKLILKNIKALIEKGSKVWIRIPVIPKINDSVDNMLQTAEFVKSLGIRDVFLLKYHDIFVGKYSMLGKKYELDGINKFTDYEWHNIVDIFERFNFDLRY